MKAASTLAESMRADAVEFDELHKTYGPVLGLVKELLGVVPNCDMYLEIWPPAFRTYNLMVPGFLNLPALLFGTGAPKDMVGLALYESSRAADCNYCSAHTCSFALRRGATPDAVSGAGRLPREEAVADMARALSTMPHSFTIEHRREVERYFGAVDTEWIGFGVAMMGFLNKFMDAMGVDLEADSIADVSKLIGPTGWEVGQHGWDLRDPSSVGDKTPPIDSLGNYARIIKNAPGAVRLEKKWMKGIPKDQVEARNYVFEQFGIDESIITRATLKKPALALAGMLAENLRPQNTTIGLAHKALISRAFADVTQSDYIRTHADALVGRHGTVPDDDPLAAALAQLVAAVGPSPAEVLPADVVDLRVELRPEQVVEAVAWISVLQLQHRMDLFLG